MDTTLLMAISVCAGALTTLAGMGGGVLLTLALSAAFDPMFALIVSGPALLVGNLHRLFLYRADLDRDVSLRYGGGGALGAVIGGGLAVALPPAVLHGLMLGLALIVAVRAAFGLRFSVPRALITAGGALVGFVTATAGGGGLLAGPMLLATGLTGRPYVATAAAGAATIHIARMAAYGVGGAIEARPLALGLLAACCTPIGNVLAESVRGRLPAAAIPRIELGVVLLSCGLAVAGVV